MKETLIYFGKPNVNGKTYVAGDFEMPTTVPVVIERTNNFNMKFMDQVGSANLEKNDETVSAEVTLSGEHAEYAKSKIAEGYKFVSSGSGYVDESGYIREYRMLRIILTNEPTNVY